MNPHTNNFRQRRTEHRFYAEIITDITTKNVKAFNRTIPKLKKKKWTTPVYWNIVESGVTSISIQF